jgi:hypothetical protein
MKEVELRAIASTTGRIAAAVAGDLGVTAISTDVEDVLLRRPIRRVGRRS